MSAPDTPYIATCPVGCSAPLVATTLLQPEGALRRCAECGQWVSSCTEAQYIDALGRFDNAAGTTPDARSVARHDVVSTQRLRKILAVAGKPASAVRLLDVGCSTGAFLMTARQLGCAVEGVEPSADAAATARGAGLKVFTGYLEDARFADDTFDVATLIEIVEHLRDPRALLAECRRILKPGGVLLITTPNAASWTAGVMDSRWDGLSLYAMGGHISFFSPRSLQIIARRSGFEVARIETRNVRFFEKRQCSAAVYAVAKIASELLNWPARLAGRGHDLHAYLRKPLTG